MSFLKHKCKLLKKATAFTVSVLLSATCFTAGLTASADNQYAKISITACVDSSGKSIKAIDNASIDGHKLVTKGYGMSKISADGEIAFCIEPSQSVSGGDILPYDQSPVWDNLSEHRKNGIKIALMYGYNGNLKNFTQAKDEVYIATQFIIWETVSGLRDGDNFSCTNPTLINAMYKGGETNIGIKQVYDIIDKALKEFYIIPSFTYETVEQAEKQEMLWNEDDNIYELTLNDSNSVLGNYKISSADGIIANIDGNNCSFQSETANKGVTVAFEKNLPTQKAEAKLVLLGDNKHQDLIMGVDCNIKGKSAFCVVFAKEIVKPTEAPTPEPTEPPTEAPTPEPTEPPTEAPTPAPTEPPTEAPTPEPTEPPTEAPTPEPTEPPTEAPTPEPTEPPTEEPTPAPTEPPTEEPTSAPTEPLTEEPTPTPTEPPTEEPTPTPTEPPTEEPTPAPTEPPTEEPTPTPTEPLTEKPTPAPTEKPTKPIEKSTETIIIHTNTNTITPETQIVPLSVSAGKVATGDSQTTIIVLSAIASISGLVAFILRRKRSK